MTGASIAFARLPEFLTAAGYDRPLVDAAERMLDGSEDALIRSRLLLERFFRASTVMDRLSVSPAICRALVPH